MNKYLMLIGLISSQASFAACDYYKTIRDQAVDDCMHNTGVDEDYAKRGDDGGWPNNFLATILGSDACDRAKAAQQDYEFCFEKEAKLKKDVEEDLTRRSFELRIQVKLSGSISSYLTSLSEVRKEHKQAIDDIIQEYINEGFDINDPSIAAEIDERSKKLESVLIEKLFQRMKVK